MAQSKGAGKGSQREFLLFNVSGLIGTALFYVFNQWVAPVVEASLEGSALAEHTSAAAWVVSYLASIVWQHALHRAIVFGGGGSYWRSLMWTYVSYSLSILLSTGVNDVLSHFLGVPHTPAFVASLLVTGVFNYFAVSSAFAGPGDGAKQA